MSKTIYITDKDALDVDRVVVSTGDLKGCKVLYSCDLIDEYEAKPKADMVAMLSELQLEIEEKHRETDCMNDWNDGYNTCLVDAYNSIQQKINELGGVDQCGLVQ